MQYYKDYKIKEIINNNKEIRVKVSYYKGCYEDKENLLEDKIDKDIYSRKELLVTETYRFVDLNVDLEKEFKKRLKERVNHNLKSIKEQDDDQQ